MRRNYKPERNCANFDDVIAQRRSDDTEATRKDGTEALRQNKCRAVEREMADFGEVDRFGQVLKQSDETRLAFECNRMEKDLAERRLEREGRTEHFKRDRNARAQEFENDRALRREEREASELAGIEKINMMIFATLDFLKSNKKN